MRRTNTRSMKLISGASVALCVAATFAATATASAPPFSQMLTTTMAESRSFPMAAPLPDGRILIAGGYGGGAKSSAEVFDPSNETFTKLEGAGRQLPQAIWAGVAAPLPDGRALIAGGFTGSSYSAAASVFDPNTDQFTSLPASMQVPRTNAAATTLADGEVLIAGGYNSSGNYLSSAELYDPATETFSALAGSGGQMRASRYGPTATRLADGRVLIVGGENASGTETSAEVFDPTTGTFTALTGPDRSATVGRYGADAARLGNGDVLIVGGWGSNGNGSPEVFDPTTMTFSSIEASGAALQAQRTGATIASLGDEDVLLAGGEGSPANTAELLHVGPPSERPAGGDFGAQTVGHPASTQTLVVSSTQILPLSISGIALEGPDSSDFTVKSDDCTGALLALRQVCVISVGFTPSAPGTRTASIALADNETSPAPIPLTGIGLGPEAIPATPGPAGADGKSGATGPRGLAGPAGTGVPAARCLRVGMSLYHAGQESWQVRTCERSQLPSATRVRLTRGRTVFAVGDVTSQNGKPWLELWQRERVAPGYYSLRMISGRGSTTRVTRLIVRVT